MSHEYYNSLWRDAMTECRAQVLREMLLNKVVVVRSRDEAMKMLGYLYVRYVSCLRKLDQCYDQIVQPQKLILLRSSLDAVVGRLLELKQEMISVDLTEVQFFGDLLSDLKLAPDEMEIPIPKYYYLDNREKAMAREDKIASMLDRTKKKISGEKPEMTREEAIVAIQTAERYRQAQMRMQLMRDAYKQNASPAEASQKRLPSRGWRLDQEEAATVLQKSWRGYRERQRALSEAIQTKRFLGIFPLPSAEKDIKEDVDRLTESRRMIRRRRNAEHETIVARIKHQVENLEAVYMEEELQDKIRCWYIDMINASGQVPDFPTEDVEGSASLFQFPELIEKKIEKIMEEDILKKERSKRREEGEHSLVASKFFSLLHKNCVRYEMEWESCDFNKNREEKTDEEMILAQKRASMWREIRKKVDEYMRLELEQLKDVIERNKTRKTMTKKRTKKVKRKVAPKGTKRAREKDLTPDRTPDSLFEELVINGIIKLPKKIRIKDAVGDINFIAEDSQHYIRENVEAAGDIRRTITEHCILPLGSPAVHELCPYTRSILLAGPKGCGKHMWVYCVCTELGATLFDLTAANIVGKYPGKPGLKMLLHLVNKVSRMMQPSVIMIDSVERTFMKKVPRHDRTEPKRLKKDLQTLVKNVGTNDRILLVGLSSEPWLGDAKGMNQAFQRMILITKPNYNTRRALWMRALRGYLDADAVDAIDVTTLAKVSDGYSCASILRSVDEALTQKRIRSLPHQNLLESELLKPMSKMIPIHTEEEDMFRKWYRTKSVMGRKVAKRESEENTKKKDNKRITPRRARTKK